MRRRWLVAMLSLLGACALGASCGGGGTPSGTPPDLHLTLDGVDPGLDALLVAAPGGVYATLTIQEGSDPIDISSLKAGLVRWGDGQVVDAAPLFARVPYGAVGLLFLLGLPDGTYTLNVSLSDTAGRTGQTGYSFAVRAFPGAPPIGTDQKIWLDFTSDRDAVPGPDFPVDLQAFGLGSTLAPALSQTVENDVIAAVLDRVRQVYHDANPLQLPHPDPVEVSFSSTDPGGTSVTRVCVGGEDPSGGNTIGSILIDPNNGNRSSVECGTLPPTGVFPREILTYSAQSAFQQAFAPVMPSLGGTPAGEDPLDPVVLDPAFDPLTASSAEWQRWSDLQAAIQAFSDALGSVVAHEVGHALGLVAPGPPGVGLYGGSTGAAFSHDVLADLVTPPAGNQIMKQGGTFSFAALAGLQGQPLPFLRPLDFAYLRDRLRVDSRVTQLLPPPSVTGVTPSVISSSATLTVSGSDFAATPQLRLESPGFSYDMVGEAFVDAGTVTGYVSRIQILPGTYDLVVTNPDGQRDVLAGAVQIQ